jgi:hypothetical protein
MQGKDNGDRRMKKGSGEGKIFDDVFFAHRFQWAPVLPLPESGAVAIVLTLNLAETVALQSQSYVVNHTNTGTYSPPLAQNPNSAHAWNKTGDLSIADTDGVSLFLLRHMHSRTFVYDSDTAVINPVGASVLV